ncbi:MAG: FKBP-type peptidyl-prolyl cis-trans isomerase [Opitutales bacterium]
MRTFVALILLGLALLTLAIVVRSGIFARKNPGEPINSAMRLAMENEGIPEYSTDDALLIARKFPSSHRLSSGLIYVPRRAGAGPMPTTGQELTVTYVGRLLDGTVIDDSHETKPLTFQVGVGQVIPGWDQAFLTMRPGGKRTLVVPYWLGYGVNGRPPKIPPRATLVFDVDLLDVR